MKYKFLLLSGALATLIYVATVILGGILRPDYSHLSEAVSALIATGAPNRPILNPLFALYNILTGVFGISLFFFVSSKGRTRAKLNLGTLGAIVLVAEAAFGFVTVLFPQDPDLPPPVTSAGMMHIILAGLSSLTTMAAILLRASGSGGSQV
jgi:hypothetical protein